MVIGIYCRVSTASQKDNMSIGIQRKSGIEFCEKNNHSYILYEEQVSGTVVHNEREVFSRLHQDIIDKRVDGIFVFDWDRLFRAFNVGALLQDMLLETKVKLFVRGVEKDLTKDADILEYGIGTIFSDYWRRKITQVMSAGKYEKWRKGEGLNKAGLGYRLKEGGILEVDPATSKIVKDMFKFFLYKNVKSYEEVLRRLRKKYGKVKGLSSSSRVREALCNTRYLGSYTITDKHGEEYTFKFENIIEEETFDKAQEKVKYLVGLRRGSTKENYLLKGKIICADCGDRMWVKGGGMESNGKVYRYHYCKNDKRNSRLKKNLSEIEPKICDSIERRNNTISKDVIEDLVWDNLKLMLKNSEYIRKQYVKRFEAKKGESKVNEGKLGFYENKLIRLEERKSKMLSLVSSDDLSVEEYNTWKVDDYMVTSTDIKKNIRELKEEISKVVTEEEVDNHLKLLEKDLEIKFNTNRFNSKRGLIEQYVDWVSVKRLNIEPEYEIKIKLLFEDENKPKKLTYYGNGNYTKTKGSEKDKQGNDAYISKNQSMQVCFLTYKRFQVVIVLRVTVGWNGSWIETDSIEYDF